MPENIEKEPTLDGAEYESMTRAATDRNVQLNEKISETEYQVLHPETNAYQVITNELRRFVSDEDKKRWGEGAAAGLAALHYVGTWTAGAKYKQHDVVYYVDQSVSIDANVNNRANVGMFYIKTTEGEEEANSSNHPSSTSLTSGSRSGWLNIDFRSFLASRAETVNVSSGLQGANQDVLVTFVVKGQNGGTDYKTICTDDEFKYNPNTGTLKLTRLEVGEHIKLETVNGKGVVTADKFVGNLEGTADNAINYVKYERDEEGKILPDSTTTNVEIDSTILGINKRLDDITSGTGGAVLSNALTISKNGTTLNAPGFTGAAAQDVNITFTPKEITDLLDGKDKIQEKWLPQFMLGAMRYVGTFDATQGIMVTDLREDKSTFKKGDYAIAVANGNLDPSGKNHIVETAEASYYIIGDWAVYNGDLDDDNLLDAEEWTKVDNTDAVRTVNEQIGNVKTYKGEWIATNYYQGDIVKYNGALYVCNNTHASVEADWAIEGGNPNFDIFGRVYSASDGIILDVEDNCTFKHDFNTATSSTVTLTPAAGTSITVSEVTLNDKFGHVSNVITKNITLPEDTWRPVYVDGSQVLDNNTNDNNTPLRFVDGNKIDAKWDATDRTVQFDHNNNGALGAGEFETAYDETTAAANIKLNAGTRFTLPTFEWDEYGHIIDKGTSIVELPTSLIGHKHFNIKKDESTGSMVIQAYEANEFTDLKAEDKPLRFYLGDALAETTNPKSMNFNGIFRATSLWQVRNGAWSKAIDESANIFSGLKFNGDAILTKFNAANNRFELGDSGVVQGVYSALAVNTKGIVTGGGAILEFGNIENNDPSDLLVIGGLFFRMHSTNDTNAPVKE